jgi:hypothetical protein
LVIPSFSVSHDLRDLGDFLSALRMNVASKQSKAARYFGLTHPTVSRKPLIGSATSLRWQRCMFSAQKVSKR